MCPNIKVLVFLSALLSCISTNAQSTLQTFDSNSILKSRRKGVIQHHTQKNITSILVGKKYDLKYYQAKENSQFFENKPPEIGSVEYDKVFFYNITIQYDLYKQDVVILKELEDQHHYITLATERVTQFSIGDDWFYHIKEDSLLNNGFYQLAYSDNKSKLLVQRSAEKEETQTTSVVEVKFKQESTYFLKNKRGTFEVKNKKDFLKSYDDPTLVKEVLKRNKIRFSKRKIELALIKSLTILGK